MGMGFIIIIKIPDIGMGKIHSFRNGLTQFKWQTLARITPGQLNKYRFRIFQTNSKDIKLNI